MEGYEEKALFGLLVKILATVRERRNAEETIRSAQATLAMALDTIEKLRTATSLFGIDPSSQDFYRDVRNVLGDDLLIAAYELSGGQSESSGTASIDDVNALLSTDKPDPDESRIKGLVLQNVRASGTSGIRAKTIIVALRTRGIVMHDKTVGMTLYRLSLDGTVSRKGRDWYATEYFPSDH
jgi:hypothetical protein